MALQHDVQTILDGGVRAGDVVGAAAQIVTGDGLLAAAVAGERSADAAAGAGPMTLDTVCWIASMTKAITGTAAMQLVERGELHLDAPAASVLPNLADAGVLEGFDDDGRPVVRPARAPITLHHLLTHTSGFGYDTWSEPLLRYQQAAGTVSMTSGELVATTTMPALFDPGEGWMYGISIDIVGRMVEEVSGQRLDHYFDEHISVHWDGLHLIRAPRRDAVPPLGDARSTAGRLTGCHRARPVPRTEVPVGRRRALQHGRGLLPVPADDPGPGQPRRRGDPAR